jgi:hypothetical protein
MTVGVGVGVAFWVATAVGFVEDAVWLAVVHPANAMTTATARRIW